MTALTILLGEEKICDSNKATKDGLKRNLEGIIKKKIGSPAYLVSAFDVNNVR
ncbi:Replicase polyprotein 1ab [Gossypium arboreum]|uniref:Replicase polyprotein 1ab n=1 Tax=Gossypium arboreum TaxID=29729 RepID=A0A0B0PEN3_GOSAR|nr:Replicase polyprotein 1ab [Gossypium arboreum]